MKPVLILPLLCLVGLSACDEEVASETEERVRAIKTFVVTDRAGADQRRFSGSLEASDTSGLAFSVSGTVVTVAVVQGDRVNAGDVLATLDPVPFESDVTAAQAELAASRAAYAEAESELDRQQTLFDKGWVTQAALDQALAAFRSAQAELNLYRTRLGTAQRDRDHSELRAPFDGVVAGRSVEPFEEIQAGASLFQINSEGALETVFSVPDTIVDRLSLGDEILVNVRTLQDCGCVAAITEIGRASGAANTVDVRASLLSAVDDLLPGMAVEITAFLSDASDERGLLVPLSAIAPGDDSAHGYVFLFDPETETVRRSPVQGSDGVDGNMVEIVEGVEAGDTIASAGVSFLRDGQSVRLLEE